MLKRLCIKGFSLIELMVVIAIIAILAAVAVPLYRDHLEKTKLVSAMNFVNTQLDGSVQYYNTHGQFGNIAQIGLPTDVGSDDVTATGFYKLTGGGAFVGSVGVNQVIPYTGCPYMNFTANIAPNDYSGMDFTALAAVKARSMFVQKYVIDVNGTVVQKCYYDYLEITNAGLINLSGDYLPNCINQHDYPNAQLDAQNIIDNSC